jgi:hypothetical protein
LFSFCEIFLKINTYSIWIVGLTKWNIASQNLASREGQFNASRTRKKGEMAARNRISSDEYAPNPAKGVPLPDPRRKSTIHTIESLFF